jgi:hypothetical protein
MNVAGVEEIHGPTCATHEPLSIWDAILYEPVPSGPNTMPDDGHSPVSNTTQSPNDPIQIENQRIPLPSNGSTGPAYAQLELSHRISHSDHHLNRIRDLIAEKSFQYSHVIRVSPRKGVNTHSRAAVKKLNFQISVHCRLYTQCRSRLLTLSADPATIYRFRKLTIEDVKASTNIVNPNEPGSTRLKLSWIWQAAGGHRWGLATGTTGTATGETGPDKNVVECKFFWFRLHHAYYSQFVVCIGCGPVPNL